MDFKSIVSTDSTTRPDGIYYTLFFRVCQIFIEKKLIFNAKSVVFDAILMHYVINFLKSQTKISFS